MKDTLNTFIFCIRLSGLIVEGRKHNCNVEISNCVHPVNICGDTEGKTNNAYLEVKLTVKGTRNIF